MKHIKFILTLLVFASVSSGKCMDNFRCEITSDFAATDRSFEALPDSPGGSTLSDCSSSDGSIEYSPYRHARVLDLSNRHRDEILRIITAMSPEEKESYVVLKLNGNPLNDNQLLYLPAGVRLFKNLREIDLSNNRISKIPSELLELRRLKKINLSNNRLSSLDNESIENLRSLVRTIWDLDLSSNELEALPEDLFYPNKRNDENMLKALKLSNNAIKKLPESLCCCRDLRVLDASGNGLIKFPARLPLLKKLVYVNLLGSGLGQRFMGTGQDRCNNEHELKEFLNFYVDALLANNPASDITLLVVRNDEEHPNKVIVNSRIKEAMDKISGFRKSGVRKKRKSINPREFYSRTSENESFDDLEIRYTLGQILRNCLRPRPILSAPEKRTAPIPPPSRRLGEQGGITRPTPPPPREGLGNRQRRR